MPLLPPVIRAFSPVSFIMPSFLQDQLSRAIGVVSRAKVAEMHKKKASNAKLKENDAHEMG
jgi:hypothetical protein